MFSYHKVKEHPKLFLAMTGLNHAEFHQLLLHFLGLAERTVAGILTDLRRAGYISATRADRHNVYTIHANLPMRHPSQASQTVHEFFGILRHRRAQHKVHA